MTGVNGPADDVSKADGTARQSRFLRESPVPGFRPRDAGNQPTKAYERATNTYHQRWEHPAQRSFWHSLDAAERKAFADSANEEMFWAGSMLCRQDDSTTDVVVIKAGWAKVTAAADGREKIIALRGPGDVVGERAALMEACRSATVVAMDNVRALVITADRFRALLMEHPRVIEVLKRQEVERLAEDSDSLFANERADVEHRLAGLLLELAVRRGGYNEDGAVTITLPITAQELADWVDAKPEAVSHHLETWRQMAIIHADRYSITVVDAAGLEKICGIAIRPPLPVGAGITLVGLNPLAPLNCSIFYTDVAGFGDPRRDDYDRRVVRDGMYRILREAFHGSGVPWEACLHEDRGDGVLTVAPPTVSTVSLVDPLLALLTAKLWRYNRQAGDPVRIQLRCALHVGPVFRDEQGLCGQALIDAARMLEAPILKESLAATQADLAFITSAHVYDTVIRHAPGFVDPAAYQPVYFEVKEARTTGWIYLAGLQRELSPAQATPRPAGPPAGGSQ
jgi:CRP-like cAMP-binding protein